jgi:hypothetical protein
MTPIAEQYRNAYSLALNFLKQNENALPYFQQTLVMCCIAYLIERTACSMHSANEVCLQALGELTASHLDEYIDCSRTTSFALFITNAQGQRRVYTIAEILRLIKESAPAAT